MLAILVYDSVSAPLVERLLAEGRLPTLAALRARGRWQPLETPAPLFPASAHHTLYSGVAVSDHGLHYPFQWSAAAQRVRTVYDLPAPATVWEHLAHAGRRALVIDPYEARPPAAVEGIAVSGWQASNRVVQRRWSRPEGALGTWERRLGRAGPADEVFGRPEVAMLERLEQRLRAGPGRAAALAAELLAREQFDLLWVTFNPCHLAGHQFWDVAQVLAPEDAEAAPRFAATLADVYEAVDAAAGRVLGALPEGTDVIALSPLGMGVNTSRADFLPDMLDAVVGGARSAAARPRRGSVWRIRAAVPTSWRASLAAVLPDGVAIELTARLEHRGVDWASTRAFVVPSDTNGYVRLNLRGRERDGIVDPAEADALLTEIAAGLATFVEESGEPALADVVRPAESLPPGPGRELLPDLVVRWAASPSAGVRRMESPVYGEVVRPGMGTGRSGNHDADAWVLVCPSSTAARDPGRPPRLEDVAATALAVLGADPEVTSGEPLLERP